MPPVGREYRLEEPDGWGQAHWEGSGDRLSVTGREWIADQILGLGFRLVCGLELEKRLDLPRSVEPSRLSLS
jgi:hypothetical protein